MFRKFLASIIKHWWSLISTALGIIDLIAKALGVVTNVPQWISWGCILAGLLLASVLAYRDLYREYEQDKDKLLRQEWEYTRPLLIEYRKPYLTRINEVLFEVQNNLSTMVKEASAEPVDYEKLDEISDYAVRRAGGLGLIRKSDKASNLLPLFLLIGMNAANMGIEKAKTSNQEWQQLEKELSELESQITDRELSEAIRDYILELDKSYNYEIFSQYVDKKEVNADLHTKAITFTSRYHRDKQLAKYRARIARRIEELLTGDMAE